MISPIIDSFVRLICKCLILLISNINSPFPEEHNTYVGEQQRTFCYRKLPFLHFSSDVNIEKKRNSGWVRSELVHQGQMQCQYWLCKSSDFFPDFVDNFPDFSPISLLDVLWNHNFHMVCIRPCSWLRSATHGAWINIILARNLIFCLCDLIASNYVQWVSFLSVC